VRPPGLPKIEKDANYIQKSIAEYTDKELDEETLRALAKTAATALATRNRVAGGRLKPEHINAVYASLVHLKDKVVDQHMLKINATRLAANWKHIATERAISWWDGSPIKCSVLCQGLLRKPPLPDGRRMFDARIKVKDSIVAGMSVDVVLPEALLEVFAIHKSGTYRLKPGPEDVSGMEFMATLEVRGETVRISDLYCRDIQTTRNKELMKARTDYGKCATPDVACYQCAKNIRQCSLAIWLPKEDDE
jgi:hypothetical protein